jgi:hypothetical protein
MWAVAGLWEAARLAERIGVPSMLRDVGRLDSTMVGAVAYFHPCRLYMGAKLGEDIDRAMRFTLDTIWGYFVEGGFRHDAAWNCYGPYLTLQLAHAFLLRGDLERMDHLLRWSLDNAGFAKVSRRDGQPANPWQVALGAWNEQHCYPVATDFARIPSGSWYMGDIPHGWACAEFILLLRDMLFFEADEDADPHIFLMPGVLPEWLANGQSIHVENARTVFGNHLAFTARHDQPAKTIEIEITRQPRPDVRFIYACRFGAGVASASADGVALPVSSRDVSLPAGTRRIRVSYL